MNAMKASRGFTLIELLVALVIIGLFAGLISNMGRPDERELLRLEAERLAQLLEFAAAEARMSGKTIAWTTDGASYRFSWHQKGNFSWHQKGNGWSEIHNNGLFRNRLLPPDMKIVSMVIETSPLRDFMPLEFRPHGSALSYAIEIAMGMERYTVAGSPVGDVQAMSGDEKRNDEAGKQWSR